MAGASKFGGTENGADCSKCGGTVAVLFKTRNGTSLLNSNHNNIILTASDFALMMHYFLIPSSSALYFCSSQ